MELIKIYEGLKENLEEIEPRKMKLEETVENYGRIIAEAKKKLEAAENELKEVTDKIFALKSAMENLELIDVHGEAHDEAKVETPKTEIEKILDGNKIIRQPIKQPKWTRKNGRLVQFDRYENKLDTFATQAAAARKLGWDQSSICRFMKFNKDEQIRRKNFYFKWEF